MKVTIKAEGFQTLSEPKKDSSATEQIKVAEEVKVEDKQSTKGE